VNPVGTLEECECYFSTIWIDLLSRAFLTLLHPLDPFSDLRIVFKRYATIGPKKDEIDQDNFAKVRGIISFLRDPPHLTHLTHFFIIEDGREIGRQSERTSIA
jgi:hypothetical protein